MGTSPNAKSKRGKKWNGRKSKERYAMQEIVGKRGEDCTLLTTQAAPSFLEDFYFSRHYCQCATVLPHLFVCVFSASSLLIYCNKYLQMWEEKSLSSLVCEKLMWQWEKWVMELEWRRRSFLSRRILTIFLQIAMPTSQNS